jgi:trimeric autotransporter adhesin
MKRIRIARPSPAFVVASLALFISLGGVGYSQLNLPNKSIGSHHLTPDLIKGRHLANDAVDSQHLARAAVDSHHLAADSVKKQEIASKAVTRQALQRNAIISRLVANGSLRREDFAPDAVPARLYAAP